MTEIKQFKVSTGLKDLVGRELITDDFVAVFELVKNSFDAHARRVKLTFKADEIAISDDGKGMSRSDVLDKWLFVAYSAKRDGTEDQNYRDRIGERNRSYAGAKGVGRFSCDRLGAHLQLLTRSDGSDVQILDVDWADFEKDSKEEFDKVDVKLSSASNFPAEIGRDLGELGTELRITQLRSHWARADLQRLKRELAKLIDPFSRNSKNFSIEISAPDEVSNDITDSDFNIGLKENQTPRTIVNGVIENPILDVLHRRTTSINISLVEGGTIIESTLEDRGSLIYKIRESNTYSGIEQTNLNASVFFLNHSAKMVFAHRMGLPAVQFGSIFLFRNGFRVLPIGAEDDDFFKLNRRKQQGVRRYLGSRDVIGSVEIDGTPGFNEATSRNQGLIETPQVRSLISCIVDKCIRRLERYVIDITWKDSFDKETEDTSRIMLDESSARVAQLVSRLAATEGIELLDYNRDIVRIVDDKSKEFETSLKALELLADQTGDASLLARVDDAKKRIRDLQIAEAEAREAERRAEARAQTAERAAAVSEQRYSSEVQRNAFLVAATSLDQDTILNLHHQILLQASDVQATIKRIMLRLRANIPISTEEWISFLESISYRNSQIITAARFATKGGYKQQSSEIEADLSIYIQDYVDRVASLWSPQGIELHVVNECRPTLTRFKPIEVGILVDNLVANADKAGADNIWFHLNTTKGAKPTVEITVADDGGGWSPVLRPVARALEKGATTSNGSGLGLYHVKQVVESLKGDIELVEAAYSEEACGAQIKIRIPT